MYKDYFKLIEKPFENVPNPKYLYLSPSHEEAIARILYAIKENKGCAMLSGVYGYGSRGKLDCFMGLHPGRDKNWSIQQAATLI
ncbi:MAG: hypothetical protein ABIJ11_04940 [Elusimicrobiota bacterium]